MSSQHPLVSVVMPVYNTEKYIGEAIESILGQTLEDFEFIIIDDGSTDRSWKIIQEYAKKDGRIKASQNKENKGISYTRNKLITLTYTNYIASQDSDDISLPTRLQDSYDFLSKDDDYAVVSGNNEIIDKEGEVIGCRKYNNNISKIILKKSPLSQPSSMFRKDIFEKVGGYDSKLNYGEDYDLWLKMYAQGYKIKNLSEVLIQLRIRSGQTKSSKIKETLKNTLFIQKRAVKEYLVKASLGDKVYWILENFLIYLPNKIVLFLFKQVTYGMRK